MQDAGPCHVRLCNASNCHFSLPLQRKEREIQQKLEEKEESAVEIKETYNSLQQEVDVKTKKLKKVSMALVGCRVSGHRMFCSCR